MKNYIDVSTVTDITFVLKVIGLTLVSWVPLHTVRFLSERWDPSEAAKIMKRAKIMQKQEEEEEAALKREQEKAEKEKKERGAPKKKVVVKKTDKQPNSGLNAQLLVDEEKSSP